MMKATQSVDYGITSIIAYFHVQCRANASNRFLSCSYNLPNSGSMHICNLSHIWNSVVLIGKNIFSSAT